MDTFIATAIAGLSTSLASIVVAAIGARKARRAAKEQRLILETIETIEGDGTADASPRGIRLNDAQTTRDIIERLRISAKEAERAAEELATNLEERSDALADAEKQLADLKNEASVVSDRIEAIKNTSPEAFEEFVAVVNARVSKSDRAALLYFLGGVACTVVITLLASLLS